MFKSHIPGNNLYFIFFVMICKLSGKFLSISPSCPAIFLSGKGMLNSCKYDNKCHWPSDQIYQYKFPCGRCDSHNIMVSLNHKTLEIVHKFIEIIPGYPHCTTQKAKIYTDTDSKQVDNYGFLNASCVFLDGTCPLHSLFPLYLPPAFCVTVCTTFSPCLFSESAFMIWSPVNTFSCPSAPV